MVAFLFLNRVNWPTNCYDALRLARDHDERLKNLKKIVMIMYSFFWSLKTISQIVNMSNKHDNTQDRPFARIKVPKYAFQQLVMM